MERDRKYGVTFTNSDSEKFFAAIHRTILGVLLAIVGFTAFGAGATGLVRAGQSISSSDIVSGVGFLVLGLVGIGITAGIVYWIYYLFLEGIGEGN